MVWKPSAVAGSVSAGVSYERRAGADRGTHFGEHRLDVAAGAQRQLFQFYFPKRWMIILPYLGLHELDITFGTFPDAGEAEAAGASETVESLWSCPAVLKDDVLVAGCAIGCAQWSSAMRGSER